MRALLLTLLLWQAADTVDSPTAEPRFFLYQRAVTLPAAVAEGSPVCVTLDGQVYAHAAPTLKDVRLYEGAREVPYAMTLSESAEQESEPARVLNLGRRGSRLVFDLAMPARPYTEVALDLDARNFIATAEVTGTNHAGDAPTRLGSFTLFDLTAQHLSRSTTLHLQESTFATLHIELSFSSPRGAAAPVVAPAMVRGASVPPNREAQTVYTTVAETGAVTQRGRQTVASFRLPAHVPVERVSFALPSSFTENFSRNVTVTDRAVNAPDVNASDAAMETVSGTLLRVRMNEAGREIEQEQLSIPATLGANLQEDADVEVAIDNGNDRPLPVTGVRLEMRQRRLCFKAPAAARQLTLAYGDPALDAPEYDYARLFSSSSKVVSAQLGAEQQNPAYKSRPEAPRPLTERHPELLWIMLLGVVCVLAVVALHSAKRMPK